MISKSYKLSTLASTLISLSASSAFAGDPVFEVGVGAYGSNALKVNAGLHAAAGATANGGALLGGALPGGAVISAFSTNGNPTNFAAEITARVKSDLVDALLRVSPLYSDSGNGGMNPLHEVTLRGSIKPIFLQVQEMMVRRNETDINFLKRDMSAGLPGNSELALIGFGPTFNLPADIGEIAFSLGAAYAHYQYAEKGIQENGIPRGEASIQENQFTGAYIGTHVHVRFSRIDNDLYVSYYGDVEQMAESAGLKKTTPKQTQGATFGEKVNAGFVSLDNTTFINAVTLPIGELGPELRIRFLQMPQGSEFVARLGVKFKASL